jgi:hypothetical protein
VKRNYKLKDIRLTPDSSEAANGKKKIDAAADFHKAKIAELIVDIDDALAGLPHSTKTAIIRHQFFRLFNFIHGLDLVSFAPPVVRGEEEATA